MASKVAIVGIGCRFPGADDIDEFWKVLKNGENHVIEVPKNRWNLDAFYHRDAGMPGKTNVRRAGFVEGYEKWDYKFYGINEFESLRMDPQHKFVLDSTYMALESAGITRKEVKGSNTGVYIGIMNSDYSTNFATSMVDFDNYTVTGTNDSIVSSRVNYVFDLRGPSMTIDTACSSSLIAIHNAHQAILSGECDMAVAGGVNSLLKPDIFIQLSKAGMVSPTGQCQAFSENADGYARGEGSGIVILKSYEKALEDNNPIWATISTASNHDGHTVSPITTPSMEQQIKLLDIIFDRFEVDPQTIDYIEAHGTGTKAGDPVEVRALGTFFQTDKNSTPKIIGSVKTNIGHLESAAGVAGLIKVLLMHHHQEIVPSLHFDKPSPDVPLEEFKFTVPVKPKEWPETERDFLRSSVNSFSFGGSNCHAIVTTPKSKPLNINTTSDQTDNKIVCISAVDKESLEMIKESMCANAKDFQVADLSYTSIYRRDHYACRLAIAGQNTAKVLQILEGTDVDKHVMVKFNPAKRKKFIFVFAGLGTNWEGMCQEMLKRFKVFHSTIEDISKYLKRYANWDLFDNLQNGFDLEDANITPIMTFACEVALFLLLESFGVHPDAIIGQSIGEVAAAFASGAVTLEQAVYIIYHRTRVQVQGTGGKMFVAKNIEIEKVEEVLQKYEAQANVSVYSSPMSCTISCDEDIVDTLKEDIKEVNTDCMFIDLNVTSAFHSHHMTNSADEMNSCAEIIGEEPKIDIFSTVSGAKAEEGDFITPQYWADNIRKPVKLYQAVLAVHDPSRCNVFIEIGPRPILRAHLENIFTDHALFDSVPLMRKNDELDCVTEAVCNFYNHGVDLIWTNFDNFQANVVDYPKYQFNRVDNLFMPMSATEKLLGVDQVSKYHPFVKQLDSDTKDIKILINPSKLGSIYEHKVNGLVMIPGALYAEVGLALAAFKSSSISFREVTVDFKNPLLIYNRESKQLDTIVKEYGDRTDFTVYGGSHLYCEGSITPCFHKPVPIIDVENIQHRCYIQKTGEEIYADLGRFGFSYGKAMSILEGCVRNEKEALIELNINDSLWEETQGMILHPAVIDSLLQAPGALVHSDVETFLTLPVQISKLRVYGGVQRKMYIHIEPKLSSPQTNIQYKLLLFSLIGEPIASIETFTAKIIGKQGSDPQKMFFEPHWTLISQNLHESVLLSDKYVSVSVIPRPSRDEEVNVVVPLTENHKDIENLRETLSEYRYVAVFINVDYNENYGGIEIQKVVTDYLLWLKIVVQCINEVNEKHDIIRLLIVFNNTWCIDEMNSKSTIMIPDNIIHSSLWGGIRSVQRELATLATHMVDLHQIEGATDSEQLLIVFDKLASDWQHNGELIVTTEGVFGYQIRYMEESGSKNYPTITDTGDADFDLFSTSETEVKDVFKLYTRNTSLNEQPGSVLLNVTKLIFQDASLFLPIFNADQHKASDDGCPVYCIETIGYLSNKPNILLVSCFPVPASNKVVVPISCCMPLSSIPFYKPGLLSCLVSLWTLASSIASTNVILLRGIESSMYVELFCLILQRKRVKYRLLTTEEFSSQSNKLKEREIISLIQLDKTLAEMIMRNGSIKKLVLFSTLLPVHIAAIFMTQICPLKVHRLHEHDIFVQFKINLAIQGILKWINKFGTTMQYIIDKFDSSTKLQDPLRKLFSVNYIDHQYPSRMDIPIRLTPRRLLSKTSAYIVVGGLTGLGWQCVEWLASHQAGYILIFNRRKPNEETAALIEELSSSTTCTIECYSVDVVNRSSVTAAIRTFTKNHPGVPMKGVLHGAGVTKDSFLFKMTEEQMTECFNPKISGAWNLHQATMYMNLDFFILHSSITAILGAPGQSNYGVANAFQDSLIAVRRKLGLPIQTLNWGPLDMGMLEKGMGNDRTRVTLSSTGYNFIGKGEIGVCLETAILFPKPQIMITKFDMGKLRDVIESNSDKFTNYRLYHILPKTNIENRNTPTSTLFDIQTLKDADTTKRPTIIEAYILKLVRKILSVADLMITPITNLIDAGMDSMLAMTLVNQVKKDVAVKIPLNLLFDPETTVLTLSRFIGKEYCGDDGNVEVIDSQIFVSDDSKISFPELRYIQLDNMQTFKAYHHVIDLHFGNLRISKDIIMDIIRTVVVRNPICTALFEWHKDSPTERADVKKSFLDVERALDICEVSADDPSIEKIFLRRQFDKFDSRTQTTIRFTFVIDKNSTRLAIAFSHVGFDLMGVNLFLRDFVNCLGQAQQQLPLENLQKPIEYQTTVCQILDSIFNQQSKDLREYWARQIGKGVPRVTLDTFRDFHPKKGHADVCERPLPLETQQLCDALVKSLGTSTFRLYITIYQLLLSIRSQSQRVFVITAEDLRQYSVQLLDRIECISNHVPIFADISHPSTTFKDFLKGNLEDITKTIEHGMFPYTEIVKLIPDGQNKDIHRHEILVNDVTFVSELNQYAKDAALELKIGGENPYTGVEAVMKVMVDKIANTTKFRLMLGGDCYDQHDAETFVDDFMMMLHTVTSCPNITIQQLQEKFKPKLKGLFKIRGWNGRLCEIAVCLDVNAKKIDIGKRPIYFKDVRRVSTTEDKERSELFIHQTSTSKTHRLIYNNGDKTILPLVKAIRQLPTCNHFV